MKPPAIPFYERYQNPLLALSTAFTSACFIGAGFIIAQDSPAPPRAQPRVAVSAPAVVQKVAPPVVESPLPVVVEGPKPAQIQSNGLPPGKLAEIRAFRERELQELGRFQSMRDAAIASGASPQFAERQIAKIREGIQKADLAIETGRIDD
jgi:hypothetical protein